MALTNNDLEKIGNLIEKSNKSLEKNLRNDMATKDDLKNLESNIRDDMATKQDLVENNNELIQAVETYLSRYPTKEEFFKSQDELMGEIKDLREEVTIHNHQVTRNSDDIERIKKAVFKN